MQQKKGLSGKYTCLLLVTSQRMRDFKQIPIVSLSLLLGAYIYMQRPSAAISKASFDIKDSFDFKGGREAICFPTQLESFGRKEIRSILFAVDIFTYNKILGFSEIQILYNNNYFLQKIMITRCFYNILNFASNPHYMH